MANNDQDKTLPPSNTAAPDQDAKTVFRAPPAADNDKTVFAPSQNMTNADSDKTVFAPSQPVTGAPDNDRTVFAPKQHTQPAAHNTQPAALQQAVNHDATVFSAAHAQHNADATMMQPQSNAIQPNPELKMLKERFVLEEVIGVGGMGVVYKAKDLLRVEAQDRDPYVAIKVLSEEFKTHPEAFISLQREAKKAQHLSNQNTVKVYDFDRDGDVVFMTMEFMVGKPLDELIKQYHATGLSPADSWNILQGLSLALIHAHRENIVHSDLKPGNVFVTDSGIAKVFDFGIARAVAEIDRSSSDKDRTVFDAGNLGALTPAYASREMLLGETPDVRDDIYALGCIAYEILTGDHPFTRLPADEAFNKKLKPKRIQGIKKRHWKAIEAALAFKREDRIASVEAFYKQITETKRVNVAMWFAGALSLSVAGYAYMELTKVEEPKISQAELMNQLEFKVRYELLQETIAEYIATPTFTEVWQDGLWKEMQTAEKLFPEKPTPWFYETRANIYALYLEQIQESMQSHQYNIVETLIANASRYTDEMAQLDAQSALLAEQIAALEAEKKRKAEADKKLLASNEAARKKRLAAEKAAWRKKQAQLKKANAAKAQQDEATNLYNLAMANVEEQLTCKSRINMRDFKIAIDKLRDLDNSRYLQSEKDIVNGLASCINKMADINVDYAKDAKRYALMLFKNNATISALQIKEKDRCQVSIAGLGAKGSRAVCKDTMKNGSEGPTMVVIPAGNKIKPFAISKYEVSVGQFNAYCASSKSCKAIAGQSNLPATNISLTQVKGYIKWLNKQTGKKYRLPTQREWVYAAQAKNSRLDSNRNCQINSRGIYKGKELVKVTTGKQNNWGVVNYAGNAQEWVYGAGQSLVAVGGSFHTPMEECTSKTLVAHDGHADDHTGFRLIRSIVGS